MRMHPGISMLLERYVPASGFALPDGRFVPGGVAVGINPYVAGRHRATWGADADTFRPERWLRGRQEPEAAYRERMRLYNSHDLTFGGGLRICIGRHFAIVEVYKVVATLVARFEMELVDPDLEWKVTGIWFARQKGLLCRLKLRK
jgi:cytochrome P450